VKEGSWENSEDRRMDVRDKRENNKKRNEKNER
jgi:hypothetical protein